MSDWQFRDELVLKIAILAERYAPDLRWYVDTIVTILGIAGENVSDDIWHRVVQVVTNNEDLQKYAASKFYHALESLTAHETAVKAGAYVLGEFGFALIDGDIDDGAPIIGIQQFAALHQHFPKCSSDTKAILLSAYAKMQNLYPELKSIVVPVFEAHTNSIDAELQQRSVEYLHLPDLSEATLTAVLDAMPPFPERSSSLEAKLKKQEEGKGDHDVWGQGGEKPAEGSAEGVGVEGGEEEDGHTAPAPAPRPAAAAADNDLLGLGFDAPAAAPPPAAVDPLSVPVTTRVGIDAAVRETKLPAWLAAASSKPSGVLFEDEHIQVGVRRTVAGCDAKIVFFFGNKTTTPFVGFKVRVPEAPGLASAVGDVPPSIPAKSQAKVEISVSALAPFAAPPALQVSFISVPGTGHAYPLSVPVTVSTFCERVALPAADFKQRWGALAGAPREVTAIVTPASGAPSLACATEATRDILGMEPIEAGAPGATGASTYRTKSLTPDGKPISVGALAMIIPDVAGGVYKVALRTQHEQLSGALMKVVSAHLKTA